MKLGYDFVEYTGFEDLRFKLDLLKEHGCLIIHQLNYEAYKNEFKEIAELSKEGYKLIIYTEQYDARAVDDATFSGASDMINSPLREDVLRKKIHSIGTPLPIQKQEENDARDEKLEILELEISRAKRGGHSLSLIIAEFSGILEEELDWFIQDLQEKLRDTDLVIKWSGNTILQICPFTDKNNIVEVENKIRAVMKEHYMSFKSKINLFMYGIAYPRDSDNRDELVNMLKDGLRNSIFLGSLKGGFNDIGKADVEYYRRMFGKK